MSSSTPVQSASVATASFLRAQASTLVLDVAIMSGVALALIERDGVSG
jgi:hypothetical protein